MSKRKQIRPSKFDFGHKDSEHPKSTTPVVSSDTEDKLSIDKECNESESNSDPGVDQSESTSGSNIAQVVAAVARTTSTSTVIQSTSRKRTLSIALDSAIIRRVSTAGTESDGTNGEADAEHHEIRKEDGHQQNMVGRMISHDGEDDRKPSTVGSESPHLPHDQGSVLVDARVLERKPPANDASDAPKPADRKQPIKCFICPYCETGFSNPKTLEAHQTIYCTRKPSEGNLSPSPAKRVKVLSSSSPAIDGHMHHIASSFDVSEPHVAASRIQRSSSIVSNLRVPSPEFAPLLASTGSPSVILLPCAYSRSNVLQIIGKPQTIIPVAVPRSFSSSDFAVTPLLLEESWCAGIDLVDFKLPLSHSGRTLNGQPTRNGFTLPLATQATSHDGPSTSRPIVSNTLVPPVRNGRPRSSEDGPQRKVSVESRSRSPPLDLTKKPYPCAPSPSAGTSGNDASVPKRRSLPQLKISMVTDSTAQSTTAPTPPLAPSAALHAKTYGCPKCGVAFSSRKTLEGHQAYYCKAMKSASDAFLTEPSSSAQKDHDKATVGQALCCQYCDQTTSTVWQLLQHMKTAHSLGAAYLCTLCGYRGFSMRGMKSHLKHAHSDEVTFNAASDDDDFMSKYVKRTKLFDEYDTTEADEEGSHSTDSHSEIDVDDHAHTAQPKGPPTSIDRHPKKGDRKHEGDTSSIVHGQKPTATDSQPSTSASCQTLISKYACQFCPYKSPYKGNVKRHLALVHKMEKQKNVD